MATGRGRLYDAEETLNMLLDDDDAENDDFDEPMCPGSDE